MTGPDEPGNRRSAPGGLQGGHPHRREREQHEGRGDSQLRSQAAHPPRGPVRDGQRVGDGHGDKRQHGHQGQPGTPHEEPQDEAQRD